MKRYSRWSHCLLYLELGWVQTLTHPSFGNDPVYPEALQKRSKTHFFPSSEAGTGRGKWIKLCWQSTGTTTHRASVKSLCGSGLMGSPSQQQRHCISFISCLHWPQHNNKQQLRPPLWRFCNGIWSVFFVEWLFLTYRSKLKRRHLFNSKYTF